MKVLLISEPGLNGVFRHVEALTHYLVEQGVEVALAYSSLRGSDRLTTLVQTILNQGGVALDLQVSNAPSLSDIRAMFRLRRLVGQWRPDVIHAHSSKAGALARVLRIAGIQQPIIYTPHAYYSMAPGARHAWIFREAERWLGLIGTTIHVSQDEAQYGRDNLALQSKAQRTIQNGVDLELFRPGSVATKQAWRASRGLPKAAIVLGTVGRYSGQKDPLTLYRSLPTLLQKEKNLWFAHLGEGELLGACTALWQELGIASRVISIRYDNAPAAFYQALDGFILPSRYEGLALSAVEALATDLPLILTDAPGNRDFIKMDLSHIWSSPVGDVVGLACAIAEWLQDRAAYRPCNHRVRAEKYFNRNLCYGRILEEYQQQVGATAPSLATMPFPGGISAAEKS